MKYFAQIPLQTRKNFPPLE